MLSEDPRVMFSGSAASKQQLPQTDNNLSAADKALKLTPEEKFLYQTHLNNLKTAPVRNFDKSVSTLRQATIEAGGKVYNIPTVWDGKVHTGKEAIEHAKQIGLHKFPSYSSEAEAEARYNQMHKFMGMDVEQWLKQNQ